MGYELRRKLREALGPDITGLQRAVALEIADDANERTRTSMAPLDDLVRWTGAKDSSVVRNALKRLAAAGWEFRVPIGKGKDGRVLYAVPGTRMTFRVPPFEGVALATPSEDEGEPGLTQEGATATPSKAQGGAGAHSEGATAHSEGAGATPYSSDSSAPQKTTTSPPTIQGGATATPTSGDRDYQMPKFGAFWNAYPRKKSIEKAKDAWRAAIDDGADPDRIVAAATAYAYERRGEDHRFTPYPGKWIEEARYLDEPDPPAPPPSNGQFKTAPEQMTEEELQRALQFG